MHKRRKRRTHVAIGPQQLLKACEDIVQGEVELSSWKEKIEADMLVLEEDEEEAARTEVTGSSQAAAAEPSDADEAYMNTTRQAYRDGVLTIGCCGYPNVGKSSLINGLMGR